MTVIKHDFGLEKQQTARRFRKLLSLGALHDANVRANPALYLERASERIFQLEKILFEAAEAARPPDEADPGEPLSRGVASPKMITVDEAEYQRLLNCRASVEAGLAKLGSDEEDT